jgi:hypothetical protein
VRQAFQPIILERQAESLSLKFLFLFLADRVLIVIPNETGWSWGGVGEGSPRSDLSGLASTLSIKSRLRSDHWGLILCIRAIFLRAAPTFEFLLAGNGGANVVGFLEVHQALEEVFTGKVLHQPMLVLVYAAVEVGDADVQTPRAIGYDIDVIGSQTLPLQTQSLRGDPSPAPPQLPPRFVRDDS